MKKDLYDLEVEVSAVSMIVSGLRNQIDDGASVKLNDESLALALHGVSNYLERIAENIVELDENYLLIERENVYEIG